MPLKHHDPFQSRAAQLNADVNPYVALLRDGVNSGALPIVYGEGLALLAGQWRTRLREFHKREGDSRRPLVLEIGCHKGRTLTAMASAHPEIDFVGIDITFKRVVTTAQRATSLGLKNVYCAMVNAKSLDRLFAPGELDGCVVFFPDPWVKKAKQAKHRLIDGTFCEQLAQVTAPGGFVWLKTDQAPYFASCAGYLAAAGFALARRHEQACSPLLGEDYSSTFEEGFLAAGLPTYGAKWVVKKS